MHCLPRLPFLNLLCVGTVLALATGCGRKPTGTPQLPQTVTDQQIKKSEPIKPSKQVKDMSAQEAISAAHYYESVGHQELLIATYEHIIKKASDSDIVAEHLIKLGDLYMGNAEFDEAKKQYKRAISLYPGYTGIERARYREFLAHAFTIPSPRRDQEATRATIKLGREYLTDFPLFQSTRKTVDGIVASAYYTLLTSELYTVQFYLNKFNLEQQATPLRGALKRLQYMQATLLPDMNHFVPDAAQYAVEITVPDDLLLEEGNTPEQLQAAYAVLQEKAVYLEQRITEKTAANMPSSQSALMRDRF